MTISDDPRKNYVIARCIIEDGYTYQMEYKAQTNLLFYLILNLHKIKIPDKQLSMVYKHLICSMDSLLIPKISKLPNPIQAHAWQDYFGDADMYSEYMEFFDRQIVCQGADNALQQYFYNSPLAHSVGSYRLPVVHMALGIHYRLNELIGQALAYLATTFQDGSFLKHQPPQLCNGGYLTAYQILVDQVRVDPRLGPSYTTIVIGNNNSQKVQLPKCKRILKNTKELLQTYTYLWKVPDNLDDALCELRRLAAQMMISPVQDGAEKKYIDMGTAGKLLDTLNAIDILYPNNSCPKDILLLQFLNVIYYYIALGRPNILEPGSKQCKHIDEYAVIHEMIQNNKINTSTISALLALREARNHSSATDSVYSRVTDLL